MNACTSCGRKCKWRSHKLMCYDCMKLDEQKQADKPKDKT